MMLCRLELYEYRDQFPAVAYTRCTTHDPRKLARRYLRLVRFWERDSDDPCEFVRAKVWKVNVWPEGDGYLGEVR